MTVVVPAAGTRAGPQRWVCRLVSEPSTAAPRDRCPADSLQASGGVHLLYQSCAGSGVVCFWQCRRKTKEDIVDVNKCYNCFVSAYVTIALRCFCITTVSFGKIMIVWMFTWLPLRPSQGSWPCVNISQRVTPNIQVSVAWENVLVFRLSGAHLQQDGVFVLNLNRTCLNILSL